jgi:hypothetical protein
MKTAPNGTRSNHHWHRTIVLRALLTLGSLTSLVLASGAGSHWH